MWPYLEIVTNDNDVLESGEPLLQYGKWAYKKRRDTETDTQGEGQVKTEVEIRVIRLQAKKRQGLPGATKSSERNMEQSLPYSLQKDQQPTGTLISEFWPPEL